MVLQKVSEQKIVRRRRSTDTWEGFAGRRCNGSACEKAKVNHRCMPIQSNSCACVEIMQVELYVLVCFLVCDVSKSLSCHFALTLGSVASKAAFFLNYGVLHGMTAQIGVPSVLCTQQANTVFHLAQITVNNSH